MDAFFLVDKPSGQTSFQTLRELRAVLWIKKIGHTGTLDPLATGALLVATGNYTKLIPYFEKDHKSYQATIMLDGISPSFDSDTEITYLSAEKQKYFSELLSQQKIEKIFQENFLWTISQIPPKYSALKINGKRALDRVKSGENIQMKLREVEIYSLKILSFVYPRLDIEISVSAGTYIRSIAHDLWEILWCWWYLSALRRTRVGNLWEKHMLALQDISSENTLDAHEIFSGKIFSLDDDMVFQRLQNGQRVKWDFLYPENQDIILEYNGDLHFVVAYTNSVLHPKKCIIPSS